MNKPTLVIGASTNPTKYSHMATMLLQEKGHTVYPSHPTEKVIHDLKVVNDLKKFEAPIDTVTLYVRPEILRDMLPDIIALKPRRVVFNPGTEDDDSSARLKEAGIEVLQACTLVLLKTNQY